MATSSQKSASIEHEDLVNLVVNLFCGSKVIIRGSSNIKGKYFPDVTTEKEDIEIEILPKSYLKKKADKWNNGKDKILVCGFNKFSLDNFKEIFVEKGGELIKIK